MFRIIKNRKKGECCAHGCKNATKTKDRFCAKHRHRWIKANDPVAYAYHSLKSNARRRGKDFDWPLEDFREFCRETGYVERTGKTSSSLSIDRIDHRKGYTKGNVQILTLGENGKKGHEEGTGTPF